MAQEEGSCRFTHQLTTGQLRYTKGSNRVRGAPQPYRECGALQFFQCHFFSEPQVWLGCPWCSQRAARAGACCGTSTPKPTGSGAQFQQVAETVTDLSILVTTAACKPHFRGYYNSAPYGAEGGKELQREGWTPPKADQLQEAGGSFALLQLAAPRVHLNSSLHQRFPPHPLCHM